MLHAALLGFLLVAPGVRQDPAPIDRVAMANHLRVVRQRRLPLVERAEAIEALLGLGREAQVKLEEVLEREAGLLAKENARARSTLLGAFEDRAAALLDERLDRRVREEILSERERLLATSRGGALDHEAITSICDPALERLGKLQRIRPNDVWDANENLFEDLETLRDRMAEALALGGWRTRVAERLGEDAPLDSAPDEDALFAALERAAWLATSMDEHDLEVLLANEALAGELDPEEYLGIARLNEIRILCGLRALLIDTKLCAASRGHSKDMAEQGFFSHDSPVPGKSTPWARAELAGTSASAENIAAGSRDGAGAISSWWYSPGHHTNMMGDARRIGLGRFETHWTQMFGG